MKRIMLFLFLFVTFLNVKSQDLMNLKPTSFVNDYENIFTPEQKADLIQILSDYEKKTSIEMVIATSADFEFAYKDDLANKWKVGKKGLDNGILIILSKTQRHCSFRTGYGLEEFIPDATSKTLMHRIFPETLSKGDFYNGMKQLVLATQKEIGTEGYDFLVKNKKLKELKQSEDFKSVLMTILYIFLFLIVLSGIIYIFILQYRKKKEFIELKSKISLLIKNINEFKNKFVKSNRFSKEIEDIYNNIVILTNKLVTEDTRLKMQYIYNQMLDYNATLNSIDRSIEFITKSKSELEKYLQDNYPYCEKYLKVELNNLISSINTDELDGTFDKKRMNKLIGIQNILDNKLKGFLSKTVKINNIVVDNDNLNKKIDELKTLYSEYLKKKTILSSVKIGKRYTALVNIDFYHDGYLSKITNSMIDSFSSLKSGDYDSAMNYYGNYITTISVVNSALSSVDTLFNSYNKSAKYLKSNESKLNSLSSDIDENINKSGVSYSRKSKYEDIKSDITKYKNTIGIDIILASELLTTCINDLSDLLSKIKSDISSHNYNSSSYSSSYVSSSYDSSSSSSSYSSSSSSYDGGGGSFGGGGSDSNF